MTVDHSPKMMKRYRGRWSPQSQYPCGIERLDSWSRLRVATALADAVVMPVLDNGVTFNWQSHRTEIADRSGRFELQRRRQKDFMASVVGLAQPIAPTPRLPASAPLNKSLNGRVTAYCGSCDATGRPDRCAQYYAYRISTRASL